jgi:hypothetical protein
LGRAFIDAGHALSGFCHLWRSARATWVPPGLAALCVLPTQHASQISKAPLTNQHHPFKLCAGRRSGTLRLHLLCGGPLFCGDRRLSRAPSSATPSIGCFPLRIARDPWHLANARGRAVALVGGPGRPSGLPQSGHDREPGSCHPVVTPASSPSGAQHDGDCSCLRQSDWRGHNPLHPRRCIH